MMPSVVSIVGLLDEGDRRMDTGTRSLDYLAGLFDGEGSFSIQVGLRHYKGTPSGWVNPAMSVNLYYGDGVLDHFVSAFGGQIYSHRARGGRRWHLGRRIDVLRAARTLEPLLEIKQETARRFIQALELFPDHGGGANRKAGERVWAPETMLQVAEIALTLNPPRSRRCNKTLAYVAELRAAL